MRTHRVAQRTLLSDGWDLNGKETQTEGAVCVCVADSSCCTVEANIPWGSNYTPVKVHLKRKCAIIESEQNRSRKLSLLVLETTLWGLHCQILSYGWGSQGFLRVTGPRYGARGDEAEG